MQTKALFTFRGQRRGAEEGAEWVNSPPVHGIKICLDSINSQFAISHG
jgi:hypothetical protein